MILRTIILLTVLLVSKFSFAKDEWQVDAWNTPFGSEKEPIATVYRPLKTSASQQWRICVSIPENNSYWKMIEYGVTEQAKKHNVKLKIFSAGSIKNIDIQKNQIKKCATTSDLIIIGSSSYDLLSNFYRDIAINTPIIALSNDILDNGFFAKSIVNYQKVGKILGQYLKNFYKEQKTVNAIVLPGPDYSNWSEVTLIGLKKAFKGSNIKLLEVSHGDLNKDAQNKAIQSLFYKYGSKIDLVIGNHYAILAAIEHLKNNPNLSTKIKLASIYTTAAIYREISNGKVAAAVYDFPIIQGKIAIDQAIRTLEGKELLRFVSPKIIILNKKNLSLYREIGTVEEKNRNEVTK